uniref:Uncharacterized protein n=1 Tax=Magallana gigas TaxID=29159 RepID=A0A8W8MN88_MAGGI
MADYLVAGFSYVFELHYEGPRQFRSSKSLLSALQNPVIVNKKLQKELEAHRIVGPFVTLPFDYLQISKKRRGVAGLPKLTLNQLFASYLFAERIMNYWDFSGMVAFTLINAYPWVALVLVLFLRNFPQDLNGLVKRFLEVSLDSEDEPTAIPSHLLQLSKTQLLP